MGKTDLTTSDFWESSLCQVMVNQRDDRARAETEKIQPWAQKQAELAGHVLFATSGSSGGSKWVALSREALLSSARAVNEHLSAGPEDRWLLALPDFHVGGMGIAARCYAASSSMVTMDEKWSAQAYHALAEREKVTLSSLVPTQVVDLVRSGLHAPPSLRAVLIGGGRLDDSTYSEACDLGWPIVETYGMTETASQIATASVGSRSLKVLPCWQVKTHADGRLMVKGDPLLRAYVSSDDRVEEGCQMIDPKDDDWFVTGDVVDLLDDTLTVKGRADRCVKVLGELVNLAELESDLMRFLGDGGISLQDFAVIAVPDVRRGHRLVLCCDSDAKLDEYVETYNEECSPVSRVDSIVVLGFIPRSSLGKILHAQLLDFICQDDDDNV